MSSFVTGNKLGNNGGRTYDFLNRPVQIDCRFAVAVSDTGGLGITGLQGSGIQNAFMNTNQTPGRGNNNVLNPNPQAGFAWIQLANNYARYAGGFYGAVTPTTGSAIAINATALTAGNVYVINAVGHATAGAVTIAPVADVSGSLASTYFLLFDAYGNTFVVWFSVAGVGSPPNLGVAAPFGTQGLHYVQQSISSGDTAATIGGDLATTIAALPSGISGIFSFTTGGTTTVTCTSTATNPFGPVAGPPQDGTIATGFTFVQTKYKTNDQNWHNVGVPPGIIPSNNVAFVATATGDSTGGGSTGTVKVPNVTGIHCVELVGDLNHSLSAVPSGGTPNVGGWIMIQFLASTNASVTTLVPTAPLDGSIIRLNFKVEAASIIIAGN